MNESNVPGTKEEKLEALRAQALRKGREFNEADTKEMLGIVDVSEPEVVKSVVKSAKPKVSKGKIGKK